MPAKDKRSVSPHTLPAAVRAGSTKLHLLPDILGVTPPWGHHWSVMLWAHLQLGLLQAEVRRVWGTVKSVSFPKMDLAVIEA